MQKIGSGLVWRVGCFLPHSITNTTGFVGVEIVVSTVGIDTFFQRGKVPPLRCFVDLFGYSCVLRGGFCIFF